ncbi:HD domain-containing protein, partial [Patescibacteria group bacterium]|nr:HD domain-containing protein [Patescibacteria group bacterium]
MTDWREQAKAFLVPWYLQTSAHHKDPVKHAEDVVQALEVQLHQTDPEILTAGMLHDLLEDTNATAAHIEEAFSPRVAELVQAVSHEKG